MLSSIKEALKKTEYKKLSNDTGFGLELEVENFNQKFRDHYSAENLMKQLYDKYKSNKMKEFNEIVTLLEKTTNIANFGDNILELFKEMEKFGPIHIGRYGTGKESNGWRIETDDSLEEYGIEIVTPLNNNKGLSYDEVLTSVPKIASLLKQMQFEGNENTGLHIHISNKNKVNKESYLNTFKMLTSKYSSFASLAYLSSRESDFYFQQGDYARKNNEFSKTLEKRMNFIPILLRKIFIELSRTIFNQVPSKGNNLVIDIGFNEIISNDSTSAVSFVLNKVSSTYFTEIYNSSHRVDVSLRDNTIELRGLGGKKALDNISSEQKCGQILRMAMTQVNPIISNETISTKDVIRAAHNLINETLIPELNNQIIYLNQEINKENIQNRELFDDDFTFKSINLDFDAYLEHSFINNKVIGFESNSGTKSTTVRKVDKNYKFKQTEKRFSDDTIVKKAKKTILYKTKA